MSFIHLHFHGKTTSPWHIGKRRYGDYLYTRTDYLWGRGIRGPVLRQLWRTYCPRSDLAERVDFIPERDCIGCEVFSECPFSNLRGSGDGEFKDKPRLILTNLALNDVETKVMALATLSDKYKGVVPGRAPVHIEFIPPDTGFEFEIIMMGDGVRFAKDVKRAVDISLRFFGWGGLCNEGFGRGVIEDVSENSFQTFKRRYITPIVEKLRDNDTAVFNVAPLLILERADGEIYRSVVEEGFIDKFIHSLNERYWQFYGDNIYVSIKEVLGKARTIRIGGWSRKERRGKIFTGIGNELTLRFKVRLGEGEAEALALARYGIGKYKNQGFGSLMVKEVVTG